MTGGGFEQETVGNILAPHWRFINFRIFFKGGGCFFKVGRIKKINDEFLYYREVGYILLLLVFG